MEERVTTLDLSGLSVHSVQATPAASLDAEDAHGMTELAASCAPFAASTFLPEDWDWA